MTKLKRHLKSTYHLNVLTSSHIAAKVHVTKPTNEPPADIVKKKWADKFTKVEITPAQLEARLSTFKLSNNLKPCLPQGWALKTSKSSSWFPPKVEQYLQEKFHIGEVTNLKANPLQVSVDMKCARDNSGKQLFSASECLQPQQIKGFFSRMTAAKKKSILIRHQSSTWKM